MKTRRVTILAAMAVLGFTAGACTTSSSPVAGAHTTTSSLPTTTSRPPPPHRPTLAVDLGATESGWVPVDYGDGQISVPGDWNASYDTACDFTTSPGSVFVGRTDYGFCPNGGSNKVPAVYFGPERSLTGKTTTKRTVNGIAVLRTFQSSVESSYVAPSLGVSLTLVGPAAQLVLATLTYSPRAVVLSSGKELPAAVPASWHRFSFAGLDFAAPGAWPRYVTTYYGPFCTIPGIATRQAVAMSTDTKNWPVPNCPIILPTARANAPSDGVRVDAIPGRAEPTPAGLTTDCFEIRGLTVCPYTDPAFGILYLRVSGPALPHALMFELGLAGSGLKARRILASIGAAPVEMRLVLDRTRVSAGTPIRGEPLLANTTGRVITVKACARDGWLSVGLTDSEVSYNPLNPLIVCPPTIRLSPGLNRFPISISTNFQACTQTSSQATEQLPACTSHGMPSLPPGRYTTEIVTSGLPAGTQLPPAIEVTLLPAR